MLIRELKLIVASEFVEVLDCVLMEKDRSGKFTSLCRIRIPLFNKNFELGYCYSVQSSKVGVSYVSKEVFHLMNFLEQKDWRDKLSSYDEFCDGKF